ncbi:hypothetical protein CR513_38438, partial [Mucuna pruriens]
CLELFEVENGHCQFVFSRIYYLIFGNPNYHSGETQLSCGFGDKGFMTILRNDRLKYQKDKGFMTILRNDRLKYQKKIKLHG